MKEELMSDKRSVCRKIVSTKDAPGAIGPYSQAIIANGLVFISGQLGIDSSTSKLTEGIENQTRQALNNMKAILEEAQSSLKDVAKVTVFIKNMDDFKKINEIYQSYFSYEPPARSCVEVSKLPLENALVEIEAVAVVPEGAR